MTTPPPPPPSLPTNVIQVIASGNGGTGDVWSNVLHFVRPQPFTSAAASALSDRVATAYSALTAGDVLGLNWSLTNVIVKHVAFTDVVALEYAKNVVESSANATPLPPQLAAVVSLKTGQVGRSFRGRIYIGPLGLYALDGNGRLNTGTRASLQSAFDGLRTGASTDGNPLGVYSRTRQEITPVTQVVVGVGVDTQRRRRDKIKG